MTAEVKEATLQQEEDPSPWRQGAPRLRLRRRLMLLGVTVAFAIISAIVGFPTGREIITLWVLAVLLAACGGDVRLWRRAVVRDWVPLFAVLFAYDLLRGLANKVGGWMFDLPRWVSSTDVPAATARAHLAEPLSADKALFGGQVPTVWLQQHLYDVGVAHWYDRIVVPVYLSHFVVSLLLAVVLWCVNYRLFRSYLVTLVSLTAITLVTYLLYPAVPPWMAALNHHLPAVHRVVEETLAVLDAETLSSVVEQGTAYSNPVAAMPSFHAAVPMMLLLFFWPQVGVGRRILLAGYGALMALTLVYAGEHYVVDVLFGWVYAAVAVFGVRAVTRSRGPARDIGPVSAVHELQ